MEKSVYNLKMTFTNEILGSQPGRNDTASKFLRDKLREEHPEVDVPVEEVESLPAESVKGTTCFYRTLDDRPALRNYQIKGMLKEAASQLNGTGDVKQLRSKIENAVFVGPATIPLCFTGELGILERPLRCMTAQGPRVSLARSEQVPAGATCECTLTVCHLPKFFPDEDLLREMLDYAKLIGFGQWRNSNLYGQFEYTLTSK